MHVVTGVLKLVITNGADLEREFVSAVSLMLLQDVSSRWCEMRCRHTFACLEAAHVKGDSANPDSRILSSHTIMHLPGGCITPMAFVQNHVNEQARPRTEVGRQASDMSTGRKL